MNSNHTNHTGTPDPEAEALALEVQRVQSNQSSTTLPQIPVVLTERSLFRTRPAREDRTFHIKPNVSAAQLDEAYARYDKGELTLNQIWADIHSFMHSRSTKEQNDFGFRSLGLTEDLLHDFILSLRPGLEKKAFKAVDGSSYHNYLQRAWHLFKCKRRDLQNKADDTTISSNPGDETTDSDGHTVQPVSIEDQYSLKRFNTGPWMRRVTTRRLKLEYLKLTLEGAELIVLEDMIADIPQDVTATKIGKSRHAVGRRRRKLLAALDRAI